MTLFESTVNCLLAVIFLSASLLADSNLNGEGRKNDSKRLTCKCGVKGPGNGVKIIGGSDATLKEWPWMAALIFRSYHICGASLINDKFLLTAAHCVDGYNAGPLKVRLFDHDITTPDETQSITRNIKSYIMHPKYNGNSGTNDNDIAILELVHEINIFRDGAPVPVCLPKHNYDHKNGAGVIAGWGLVSLEGILPSILQHAGVSILSRSKCLKVSFYNERSITKNMMCARGRRKDTCSGDSGGPLVTTRKSDGNYELAGITSWGISCALWKFPGIYTRVSRYINWINANTASGRFCPE